MDSHANELGKKWAVLLFMKIEQSKNKHSDLVGGL